MDRVRLDQVDDEILARWKVVRQRLSLWRTELLQLVGLLVFVGVVWALAQALKPQLSGTPLLIASLLLALIPAAIWLSLFYGQDRLEPEPKHYVLAVALLAGLLAAAVGQPLLTEIFRVTSWIGRDAMTEILGGILVVGFLQEFLKYAAVRYTVYYSREFDQRVDGVVYGSAAGIGFAAMLNIIYVFQTGGLDLGTGVFRIVVTQMVHGAIGALLGYFLGRNKIDQMPVWWMPAGLAVAAVLNGLFNWIRGEITETPIRSLSEGAISVGYNPWPGLIAAVILAAILLAVIYYLIRSNTQRDQAQLTGTTTTTTTAAATTTTTP